MLETNDLSEVANTEAAVKDFPSGELPSIDPAILEEMVKAGVLYGRKKSKTYPKMKPYIFATRNGIEIFDLNEVLSALEKAQGFLKEMAKKGETILLVGTQPAAKGLIKEAAERLGLPYVTERWLGGTLTNFPTISKRIKHFTNLKIDRESGKLEKYTKKEKGKFDKEIKRLTAFFGGLEKLVKVPSVLLVVDANDHKTAVREAKLLNIPVVALISSDTNPEGINYFIPGNSRARSSIQWVLGRLEKSVAEGIKEKAVLPATETKINAQS